MDTMETESRLRLLLIDDHAIVRRGLATVIAEQPDMEVVAQAGTVGDALATLKLHDVDVALVDLRLADGSGLKLISDICAEAPDVAPLVFSMHDDRQFAERALRAGAMGYVMKQEPTHVLLHAIRCVGKGEVFIRPEIEATVTKQAASNSKGSPANELDCLTDREIEVLQLMAEGKNRREIAKTMGLSVKTIEGYRENMKRKLSLRDTVQLAQFAVRMIDSFNV